MVKAMLCLRTMCLAVSRSLPQTRSPSRECTRSKLVQALVVVHVSLSSAKNNVSLLSVAFIKCDK